jgi:3-dehydroquinate dehydratase-2
MRLREYPAPVPGDSLLPMRVLIVNGPNLNLLGIRRPDVYGELTLGELEDRCRQWGRDLGLVVDTFQSNHEGGLIDRLHDAIGTADGVVLNPGALTHYSYALHDAIEAIGLPVVEVHISDISSREPWRAESVISPACAATISGQGIDGYRQALEHLAGLES